MERLFKKLRSRGGKMPRAAAILLILVFVMLAVVSVPTVKYLRDHSREIGCMAALDTADKELRNAYLSSGCELTPEQAKEAVARAMNGWDDLCPAGGTVHLVTEPGREMPYRLVCGIHGASSSERTLLNAKYVFEQLVRKAVSGYSENGAFPESVTASLNGEELEIMLTAEDVGITRGTGSTSGYKGTVAFYAAAGSGGFGDSFGAANGSVSWFVFADKYHCARWDARVGWSLDSTDY